MARRCELCRRRPAAVPDRYRMGRPIKRICRQCHAGRLRGDLAGILRRHQARRREVERHQARLPGLDVPDNGKGEGK